MGNRGSERLFVYQAADVASQAALDAIARDLAAPTPTLRVLQARVGFPGVPA